VHTCSARCILTSRWCIPTRRRCILARREPYLFGEAAKGNTAEGIYEVEGNRLRICLDRRSTDVKERSTRFPTEPQKGVLYLVLEREKR
jgi:hypothetical protein